jgi:hypothetical protein
MIEGELLAVGEGVILEREMQLSFAPLGPLHLVPEGALGVVRKFHEGQIEGYGKSPSLWDIDFGGVLLRFSEFDTRKWLSRSTPRPS